MEKRLPLNIQIKNAFNNPQDAIISILKVKTNAFLENYISEHYVEKEIAKNCLTTTYNWWVGKNKNKKYAIHIDDAIKPIDIAFANELKKANYEIIYITINDFEKKIIFTYQNKEYDMETFIETISLEEWKKWKKENNFSKNNEKEEPKENKKPDYINPMTYNWCYNNLDYKKLIYHSAIEMSFLTKYFFPLINLDVVWVNEINNENVFFIGEVKFKSKNKNNVFMMNNGEKMEYEYIVKNTNIQVTAIALVCNRKDRQATLVDFMNDKEFPIFYMHLKESDFHNLELKEGALSEFDKKNGETHKNVVEFPFEKFNRVFDFKEIGKDNTTFIKTLNKMLVKYSYLLHGERNYCKKHIAKFYALFEMMNDGFNVDYANFLNKDFIASNVLPINGYKVLFKFVDSLASWNVTLEENEYKLMKELNIDYILVYQDVSNNKNILFDIKEQKTNKYSFYLVNETTSLNSINVLGCIPFKLFDEYKHCLKASIPKSQINYYAVRGLKDAKGSKYKTNMNSNCPKSNNDTYFLQLLGWKKDNTDKELEECQLERYNKTKNLPFLSSYVFY